VTQQAKQKMGMFGALIVAAVLGAAAWEGISGMTRPAMAQPSVADDPRNATQFRIESVNQYKVLNAETKVIAAELKEIRKILESDKLKVVAEIPQLEEKPKSKSNSR